MKIKVVLLLTVLSFSCLAPAWGRKWTDATGDYSVEAEFVSTSDGKVRLKKANGKIVTVPIALLSETDQKHLKALAKKKTPVPNGKKPSKLPAWKEINEALAKDCTLDWKKTPLVEAMKALSVSHGIPILLDKANLDDVGIGGDLPITASIKSGSLAAALDRTLPSYELAWLVRDDVLLITSNDAEPAYLDTRVYRILRRIEPDTLIEDVTKMIDPNSWEENGGFGAVTYITPNILIVSHTQKTHRKIVGRYKRQLRPVVNDPARLIALPGLKFPLKELNDPTSLQFLDTPLKDAVKFLSDFHKIDISIDENALKNAGLGADTPITINLQGVRLASGLNLMLRRLELTWVADQHGVTITTLDAAEGKFLSLSYPVRDLAGGDTIEVVDVIASTIAQESWEDTGGKGRILDRAGAVHVRQPFHIQQKVAALLEDLRQATKR